MHAFLMRVALPLSLCASAQASEMVYTPSNPNFGGNPLNAAPLLAAAQATNKHQDPRATNNDPFARQTALQQFNDSLQRSILSQLSMAATSGVIVGGKLVPGTVQTSDFTIQIGDLGGGVLEVTTIDKATGAQTSFRVGGQ